MGFLGFSLVILFVIGFLIVALTFLLLLGVGGTVGSTIGLCFSRFMKKTGRKSSQPMKNVSLIALVASLVILAIPLSLVGALVWSLATPPEDFVETEIRIEGELEEDFDSFTADGKVYCPLYLTPDYDGCKAIATPIFCYMPEGFLNRSQWKTFCRIDNGEAFDLIWDGEELFYCTDEDREAILAHYEQKLCRWYLKKYPEYDTISFKDSPKIAPSPASMEVIKLLVLGKSTDYSYGRLEIPNYYTIDIEKVSADGAVYLDCYSLYVSDGEFYYAPDAYFNGAHTLEGHYYHLPDEMAEAILKQFSPSE